MTYFEKKKCEPHEYSCMCRVHKKPKKKRKKQHATQHFIKTPRMSMTMHPGSKVRMPEHCAEDISCRTSLI